MKATLLVLSAFLLLYGCATPLTSDMSSPSIADTKTVVFGGKTFVLKFQNRACGSISPQRKASMPGMKWWTLPSYLAR